MTGISRQSSTTSISTISTNDTDFFTDCNRDLNNDYNDRISREYSNNNNACGNLGFTETCAKHYPYPFTRFPIYIFNDSNNIESVRWLEIFPEAVIINNYDQINVNLLNVDCHGILVLLGSSFTNICRDLFLNTVITAINVCNIRGYSGFFVDDYFDKVPIGNIIFEMTPKQFLQVSTDKNLPLISRSYWASKYDQKLPAELYPPLVTRKVLPSPEFEIQNWLLIFLSIILIFAILYWIIIILYPV